MQEKKQSGKAVPLLELKSSVAEILVANGRSFQPFIRTFSYTGENVTESNLGTLVGVFEIDEITEDCAYIVNFLASVAKKEYFNNPRRGAIESFEAALHKINLALSELVKHGNITWLGKFHGALGILEKNNIHFSVTGEAKILLLRSNNVSDISIGLASPESHTHPIKTFVEVSSGRLTISDRILLTSPELLALFSLEDLAKNAKRMDGAQFTQFLKTALVNELDMAGMLLIDVREETLPTPLKREKKMPGKKSQEQISNIFSEQAFAPREPYKTPLVPDDLPLTESAQSERREEYVDTKTGHIYVQGDKAKDPGANHHFEWISLHLEEFSDAAKLFFLAQMKWLYKGKKRVFLSLSSLEGEARALGRKTIRVLRKQWRKKPAISPVPQPKGLPPQKTSPDSIIPGRDSNPTLSPSPQTTFFLRETAINHGTLPKKHLSKEGLPPFIKEKLTSFYRDRLPSPKQEVLPPLTPNNFTKRATDSIKNGAQCFEQYSQKINRSCRLVLPLGRRLSKTLAVSIQNNFQLLSSLSRKKKLILIGSVTAISTVIVASLLIARLVQDNTSSSVDATPSSQSPTDTPDTISGGEIFVTWDNVPEHIVTSTLLNNETYIITAKSILSVTTKKSFPLPGDSQVRFATAMDDLGLIFIYTENNTLYAWSPLSKAFVENTLTLNEGSVITGIGTYLTYLYVLESTSNQVYRFPRANTGFGASVPWLKEALPIESTARLAVNESLFIATDPSTIKGFFRGRATSTFEAPTNGLALTDLYTHPGLTNVYGLDKEHQKIYIWSQDGKLLREVSHKRFSDGQTLSVNEKSEEIFISTEHSLFSYKLK